MVGWVQTLVKPQQYLTFQDLEAFMSAMTSRNIISGFKVTGIFPFNRDITGSDYAPCMVTEWPDPEEPSNSADLPILSVHML